MHWMFYIGEKGQKIYNVAADFSIDIKSALQNMTFI